MSIKNIANRIFGLGKVVGRIYDRADYDAVLPSKAECRGFSLNLGRNPIRIKFRSACASENMAAGDEFSMGIMNAYRTYRSPSADQGKGLVYV